MVIKIKSIDQNNDWYIVNVYAPNIKSARKKLWGTLSNIKSKNYYGRWIFLGDFNIPLYECEKKKPGLYGFYQQRRINGFGSSRD